MKDLLLAIDQGTTSTRSILHGPDLTPLAIAQRPLAQHFPAPGWVEHEPEDIWSATLATMRDALAKGGAEASSLAGIGITNQRETTLLWDRASGRAIHRAIVWQDRRTAAQCARLAAEGAGGLIAERSGLLPDPYFSATKLAWLLDNVGGARAAAARGDLAFGTVDSFLLWRLTGGRVHATDATNAARTMLFDIRRGCWDADLLKLFDIPEAVLPEVRDNACDFGETAPGLLGVAVPVRGMAGDQHAAMLGQACFAPGMVKSTYGTGCFLLLNTGDAAVPSKNRLLTTLAWQLGGRRTYALEGAIFIAGAAVQWLRDGLGIIRDAAESGTLAARADPAQAVYFVPAFTGLGAPHWDAEARGAILGLTRNTSPAEICRAALEAVAFQTRDLVAAMRADWGAVGETVLREAASTTPLQEDASMTTLRADASKTTLRADASKTTLRVDASKTTLRADASKTTLRVDASMTTLRVDGGMTASDYAMQALADLLGAPVDRPEVQETTALGAAYLAGLQAGLLPPPGPSVAHWRLDRRFQPAMPRAEADRRHAGWRDAVRRVLTR